MGEALLGLGIGVVVVYLAIGVVLLAADWDRAKEYFDEVLRHDHWLFQIIWKTLAITVAVALWPLTLGRGKDG